MTDTPKHPEHVVVEGARYALDHQYEHWKEKVAKHSAPDPHEGPPGRWWASYMGEIFGSWDDRATWHPLDASLSDTRSVTPERIRLWAKLLGAAPGGDE